MNKLILLTLLIFMSCKKDKEEICTVTFYQVSNKHTPSLYINGHDYGMIKKIGNIPVCGFHEKDFVITLPMTSGSHLIQLRDTTGFVVNKYISVGEGCQLILVR